ncbi:MAG: CHAT domain-containing protein [Glaciimonas sp.]|nr:CHAT domain-containing protein [Glaciimonas sp.]
MQADLGGEAFIGFFRYQPAASIAAAPAAPARYLRYCVTQSKVQVVDLGEAHAIERAVTLFRSAILRKSETLGSGNLVHAMLLSKLPPSVDSAAVWRVDPDGILALLPFEALPDETGRLVLMTHIVRMVSLSKPVEGQSSPGSADSVSAKRSNAVIMANPKYDSTGPAKGNSAKQSAFGVGSFERRWTAGAVVESLPDTAQEAQRIAVALAVIGISSTLLEGVDASRENLEKVQSPKMLHIAGHAVMVDGGAALADEGTMRSGLRSESILEMVMPGRRSGLVLSRDGSPDLVLAKDIARLSLSGTTLVVLSACNTGNGDILAGEGLSGLRQALEQAGARCAITSIWAVSSTATVELMSHFYKALGKGMTIGLALCNAKRQLHAAGRSPFEWAGFLMSGTDGNLTDA